MLDSIFRILSRYGIVYLRGIGGTISLSLITVSLSPEQRCRPLAGDHPRDAGPLADLFLLALAAQVAADRAL